MLKNILTQTTLSFLQGVAMGHQDYGG
jgi:hypothetical protein